MKRGIFLGFLMSALLAVTPAGAEEIDSTAWLSGDYIGVGSIDVHKFVQRRIYTYLMDFFMTNKAAKTAMKEVSDAGIKLEDILTRIVAGVPGDVDKSEHIVIWETSVDLSKYKTILGSHTQSIDKRMYLDTEYYSTKRENECLTIHGNMLILGSELRVKEVIASIKNHYQSGPKSADLQKEMKRVKKDLDAWFVFSMTPKLKTQIAGLDPIIDMSSTGQGQLRIADVQSGNMAFDFSEGLNVKGALVMPSDDSAKQSSALMNTVLSNAAGDKDVKELGFDLFMRGIVFSASHKDVQFSVVYDQAQFDQLIALVTQMAKSVPGQPQTPKPKAVPKPEPQPK